MSITAGYPPSRCAATWPGTPVARQRGLRPHHRGLPSPYLTLIFTLDEPLTMVAHPRPGRAAR